MTLSVTAAEATPDLELIFSSFETTGEGVFGNKNAGGEYNLPHRVHIPASDADLFLCSLGVEW
jgi:hypothetical protein